MFARPLRLAITGPECTGKTTLAKRLAESLGAEWVPEASRVHAERAGRELGVHDVEPIARAHIALVDAAVERANAAEAKLLVLDTDLISTVVYAQHYYRYASRWLEREAHVRRADLYLLCDVDVPWIADSVRDRPTHRDVLFGAFRATLEARSAQATVIRGDWDARWMSACDAVGRLLSSGCQAKRA